MTHCVSYKDVQSSTGERYTMRGVLIRYGLIQETEHFYLLKCITKTGLLSEISRIIVLSK